MEYKPLTGYTVSINVFSTFEYIMIPRNKITVVIPADMPSVLHVKAPFPKNANRNVSITAVIGLTNMIVLNCAGAADNG